MIVNSFCFKCCLWVCVCLESINRIFEHNYDSISYPYDHPIPHSIYHITCFHSFSIINSVVVRAIRALPPFSLSLCSAICHHVYEFGKKYASTSRARKYHIKTQFSKFTQFSFQLSSVLLLPVFAPSSGELNELIKYYVRTKWPLDAWESAAFHSRSVIQSHDPQRHQTIIDEYNGEEVNSTIIYFCLATKNTHIHRADVAVVGVVVICLQQAWSIESELMRQAVMISLWHRSDQKKNRW